MRLRVFAGVATAVLLLSACSAEDNCRSGIEKADDAYRELYLAMQDLQKPDAVVKAGMYINEAQTQEATRNFEGCVESVKQAEQEIRRANR